MKKETLETTEEIDLFSGILEASPTLFHPHLSEKYRTEIVDRCLKLTPDPLKERVKAIDDVKSFLFTSEMHPYESAIIIRACLELTPEQIIAVAKASPILFPPQTIRWMRGWIIEACLHLTPEQIGKRAKAMDEAKPSFFTPEMSEYDRTWRIEAFLKLSPEETTKEHGESTASEQPSLNKRKSPPSDSESEPSKRQKK